MKLTNYSPIGMGELQNQINSLFSHFGDSESSGVTAGWVPTVDIREYDKQFQLFVDVPGVDPKEVDITLDNGVLTIAGERHTDHHQDDEQMVNRRTERGQGTFHRRFILPDTVDENKVKAKGNHGVLEILIPKQAKAAPRRIKVAA